MGSYRNGCRRSRPAVGFGPALVVWLLASLAAPAVSAQAPAPDEAKRFIVELAARASETLAKPDQTLEEREAAFRTLLRNGFDLKFIARIALGRYWRRVSASERAAYTELFGEFVLRTYASRLGGFKDQRFKVDDAVPRGKRDIVVQTRILQEGGPPIQAGWRIRSVDGKLRIIDVIVEGVSMSLNQRREFSAVVYRDGMKTLLEMLRARTQRLPAEPPAGRGRSE